MRMVCHRPGGIILRQEKDAGKAFTFCFNMNDLAPQMH